MQKIKFFLLFACIALFMTACIIVSGCGGDETGDDLNHTHTFAEEWSYDDTYHWHMSTCGHSSETADKGEHIQDGDSCAVCGKLMASSTEGLSYEFNGEGYEVTGVGIAKETHIIIPDTFNDLSVVGIADNAFKDNKVISGIRIPNSVMSIGNSAFA